MARRTWFSPSVLLIVIAGGAVGVALRAAVVVPLGELSHPLVVPAATLAINLLGAFLLGIIVGRLADHAPRLRAFLGTGVMGGFTTYSAFTVQSVTVSSASPLIGLVLSAVSLLGGVVAAVIGLGVGRGMAGRPAEVAASEVEAPEDAE